MALGGSGALCPAAGGAPRRLSLTGNSLGGGAATPDTVESHGHFEEFWSSGCTPIQPAHGLRGGMRAGSLFRCCLLDSK